jgi:hypothetical protein
MAADRAGDLAGDGIGPGPPVAAHDDDVLDDRQPVRAEDGLHGRLVHAHGRREHAGADVRDVGDLEQPLDRAVLSVWPVQRDEHHVEPLAQLARHTPGGLGAHERGGRVAQHAFGAVGQRLLDGAGPVAVGQRDARLLGQGPHGIAADDPAAVARDADGHDVVAPLLERGDHRGGGSQRHLMLARAPTKDHSHARHERIVAVRLDRP